MSEVVDVLSTMLQVFLFLCLICGVIFAAIIMIIVFRGLYVVIRDDRRRKKRQKLDGGST